MRLFKRPERREAFFIYQDCAGDAKAGIAPKSLKKPDRRLARQGCDPKRVNPVTTEVVDELIERAGYVKTRLANGDVCVHRADMKVSDCPSLVPAGALLVSWDQMLVPMTKAELKAARQARNLVVSAPAARPAQHRDETDPSVATITEGELNELAEKVDAVYSQEPVSA